MNIQPLSGNTPGSITLIRHQDISPDVAGTSAQPANTTPVSQQLAPSSIQSDATSSKQLADAVKATNDFVNSVNNSITFSVDKDSGKTIVKVIDKSTDEVIRQIPSEEMLVIAQALDKIKGLLVQQKV